MHITISDGFLSDESLAHHDVRSPTTERSSRTSIEESTGAIAGDKRRLGKPEDPPGETQDRMSVLALPLAVVGPGPRSETIPNETEGCHANLQTQGSQGSRRGLLKDTACIDREGAWVHTTTRPTYQRLP